MRIESFHLERNGWVPNHPRLPIIVYRGAVEDCGEAAAGRFEEVFKRHGWLPDWRDGVYGYHHYHSTAHEVLGIFAGRASLELGGPGGRMVELDAGDALMLPVGTGHRCVEASGDFQVVGAYPDGQAWDICREAPDEVARDRMRSLPDPHSDPVTGSPGLEHHLGSSDRPPVSRSRR